MDPRLDLAFQHHRAGRFGDAEPLYQQLVHHDPSNAAAWHGWGLLAAQQGAIGTALQRVDRAVELAPAEPTFWNTLGRLHAQQDDLPAAAAAYHQVIALDPSAGAVWDQLTVALRRSGRATEAVAAGEQAVRLLPTDAGAFNHLANALCDADRDADAVDHFRTAIALRPEFAEACTNLGATLTRLSEMEEALHWCDRAVALAPALPEVHNNRGVAFAAAGQLDNAVAAYRTAIELRPGYAAAHSNLGVATCDGCGDAEIALSACRRAVELEPTNAVLHTNLGLILLKLGRYGEGWAEHEWRLRANPRIAPRTLPQPRWQGEPLPSGTILLHAEQGLGDTIQFARFVPLMVQRVGRVVVECQPELVRLLRSAWDNVEVIARGQPLPAFDVHCPLMSLPLPLGVHDLSAIPSRPYLRATTWHGTLPGGVRHIGLVWAGRPTHSNDRNRSAPLAALAALGTVPGVVYHSLQKGPAALEAVIAPPPLRLQLHEDELRDFTDTAALIGALEGVVTVDTAVAHLAGALGKPVWLMLPHVAEWRWLRERADSPWYPSARLFRQQTRCDWAGVAAAVASSLRGFGTMPSQLR